MSINPTFLSEPGETLSFAIQRVSDRLVYDFSNATFSATPVTPQAALTESAILPGSYTATIASTPIGTFPNGDYVAYLYDSTIGANVGILPFVMNNGSDSTPIGGGGGGSGTDPWTLTLGSYSPGQAGYVLNDYLVNSGLYEYGEVTRNIDNSLTFSNPATPNAQPLVFNPKGNSPDYNGRTVTKGTS